MTFWRSLGTSGYIVHIVHGDHYPSRSVGVATTLESLQARRQEILRLAASHGAPNVRVFGSVARGEADESSDIDLLVKFDQERSLLDQVGLMQDLQELLGTSVEITSEKALHRLIHDRVLAESRSL